MVVIQTVEPIIEEQNKTENRPKSKPPVKEETTSSSAATTVQDSLGGRDNSTAGSASDGFETASEADLNDDDDVVEQEERDKDEQEQQPVELSEDQINEKAIAEANNAKLEGNAFFKDGLYEEALSKYEVSLQAVSNIPSSAELCSICHANRAACFFKLENCEDTIKECTKALELNPKYIKVLIRRAEAHEKLEHFEEAIADMTKVLEIDSSNDQARRNILRLKPLADEKREKMKEEMIGKLKEMGNSILGRFGMSVDNFKAVKDPNTGSYSISFQR